MMFLRDQMMTVTYPSLYFFPGGRGTQGLPTTRTEGAASSHSASERDVHPEPAGTTTGIALDTARRADRLYPGSFMLKACWDANSERPGYAVDLLDLPYELALEWTRNELAEEWPKGITKPYLLLRYLIDDSEESVGRVFDFEHVENVVGLQLTGDYSAGQPARTWGLAERLGSAPFTGLKTLKLVNCGVTEEGILDMVTIRSVEHFNDNTKEQNDGDKAHGEGLTIILGDGIEKFSKRGLRHIRTTPGVKAIRQTNQSADYWDHWADQRWSRSFDESDWKPCYPVDDESENEGSGEDDFDENEFGDNINDEEDSDDVNDE
ncbi:hypothetical protein FRB90_000720 [Tulasnella sp. 427]|nr:hypothetical protein FRB90_000720 [Tulasnella sp. 427]